MLLCATSATLGGSLCNDMRNNLSITCRDSCDDAARVHALYPFPRSSAAATASFESPSGFKRPTKSSVTLRGKGMKTRQRKIPKPSQQLSARGRSLESTLRPKQGRRDRETLACDGGPSRAKR